MKKLLFIEINTDGTIGGSHHCLYEIVKYLDKNKYLPYVMFYQENALIKDFEKICNVVLWNVNPGLVLERDYPIFKNLFVNNGPSRNILLLFQKAYNFFRYYIPNLIGIYKFLKYNEIDLVHANNGPDLTDWLIVSKILRLRVVSHLRFPWSPNRTRKLLAAWYDKIIAISDYVAFKLDTIGVSRRKVVTIHDGIDIDLLERREIPTSYIYNQFKVPPSAPIICEIGNIRRWKGQHVAIESMKHLVSKYENIRLILIGEISTSEKDVEYLNFLKELTVKNKLENNVIFTGYRKDALNILSQSDIMVHTSVIPEPLGRVILEGMVFRKPVIATNHGGPLESIEDGVSGFLIEPEDPEALAEKISFLLENREVARKVGENARKHVEEKFGIRNNVRKIEDIYKTILEGR